MMIRRGMGLQGFAGRSPLPTVQHHARLLEPFHSHGDGGRRDREIKNAASGEMQIGLGLHEARPEVRVSLRIVQ